MKTYKQIAVLSALGFFCLMGYVCLLVFTAQPKQVEETDTTNSAHVHYEMPSLLPTAWFH